MHIKSSITSLKSGPLIWLIIGGYKEGNCENPFIEIRQKYNQILLKELDNVFEVKGNKSVSFFFVFSQELFSYF